MPVRDVGVRFSLDVQRVTHGKALFFKKKQETYGCYSKLKTKKKMKKLSKTETDEPFERICCVSGDG
jgi:hypothetical protein